MFTYQKNFANPTQPVDEAQFWALVRATKWNENIDKFRATGDASLKRKLPAFIFQASFDETPSNKGKIGAWRKQSGTRLTGLVVMDVDHIENEELRVKCEEFRSAEFVEKARELGILLVYITPSGHGLKIVFKARMEWGNLIDNQHQMGRLLGFVVDESCKDASRMSFICKESDILFIDKELFTYENKAYGEKYDSEYRAGRSGASADDAVACTKVNQGNATVGEVADEPVPVTWKGYDVQRIIDARYGDKLPCAADSNRHTESLKLATDLLLMLDGDKQLVLSIVRSQPWVQEIIRERDENVAQTVESAVGCIAQKEKRYTNSSPSRAMLAAIEKATGKTYQQIIQTPEEGQVALIDDEMNRRLCKWGEQIEALMPEYPILRDICKGLKRNQYPAALFVAGGLMMTLMTRCTYRFYHRPEQLRRLNNSTLIIGDPACGKSFATRLYDLFAAPIVAADQRGVDAINAYREQMKTKGANKEKPKKPQVPVRDHPARTSNSQFIQDMVNTKEEVDGEMMQLHMLTFDTELDNTITLQKGGSWIDKQALQLKAFHNEVDGQAYSNHDSVFQKFVVVWNFIYTGTPLALDSMVNVRNFGTGLATRLTCIPLPSTDFQMLSREQEIDLESDARLAEWAKKLDRTKGELPMAKIVDELYDWTARRMMDAMEDNSKADEMLLKRCAYHGINFGSPYIMIRHWDELKKDGDFWCGDFETDETDWLLVELIVNMQFGCQKYFFGAMAEAYFDNRLKAAASNVQHQKKTQDAFSRLPEEFTVIDILRCFAISKGSTARMRIMRLVKDRLVEKVGDRVENGKAVAVYHKTGVMML